MYVVTSIAFVKRTRATLRSAEFGFFGVCVYTRIHTPRFSGQPASAGDFVLAIIPSRPILTNCENVGTVAPQSGGKIFIPGASGNGCARDSRLSQCAQSNRRE